MRCLVEPGNIFARQCAALLFPAPGAKVFCLANRNVSLVVIPVLPAMKRRAFPE
jgi:hypothetical protein